MKKKIISFTLAGAMTFSTVVFADSVVDNTSTTNNVLLEISQDELSPVTVMDRKIDFKTSDLVDIVIPVVSGLTNKEYEVKLNNIIENDVNEYINEFKKDAEKNENDVKSEIKISYDVKSIGDILSIEINHYKILAGAANGETYVSYYNIDLINNKVLNFVDIFKPNTDYKSLVNSQVNRHINKDKSNYFDGDDGFKSVKDDQEFYINKDGDIVVVFQMYEIAPRSAGVVQVKIPLEDIKDILVFEAINQVQVIDKEIKIPTKQDVSIVIPKFTGLSNKNFEKSLNEEIESIATSAVDKFNKDVEEASGVGSSELKINYDLKSSGDIISLVISNYNIISGAANGSTEKYYYNVDVINNKVLELKDLFNNGANYKDVINKEISSQIEKDKDKYFQGEEGFKSIKDKQNFYIDDSASIKIEFPMYEIGPRSAGTPVFKISNYILKDILKGYVADQGVKVLDTLVLDNKDHKLSKPMYVSKKGSLMVPIAETAKALGYEVKWNGKTKIVTLLKGNVSATASVKENSYSYLKSLVILDEEAKSVDGVTFVPVDFFDKVLKLNVSTNPKGVLEISTEVNK